MVKKLLFLSSLLCAPAGANIKPVNVFEAHPPVITATDVAPTAPLLGYVNPQINCMVRTAIAEAENQTDGAKTGVLYTIHNRAKQRHKSYCSIVNEKSQFSHRKIRWLSLHKGSTSYRKVYQLAEAVMNERIKDVTNGATFFHDDSLKRNPFRRVVRTIKLDNMVFYRTAKAVNV